MEPLSITITDLTLNTVIDGDYEGSRTLGDAIVDRAVKKLTKDGEYSEVHDGLRKRVAKIRDEEIRNLVHVELAKAMAEPITLTNSYGEPTGTPTTLRALIISKATEFFTVKRRNDSYNRSSEMTNAQLVVAEMIKNELTKELASIFAEEKARIIKAIQANAAEVIADAVRKGLR